MPQFARGTPDLVLERPVSLPISTVTEHSVGARGSRELLLLGNAHAGNHQRTHRLGQLDRGHTDAAGRTVDQHEVARTNLPDGLERVVGGEEVAPEIRARRQVHAVGRLPDRPGRDLDDFRQTPKLHLGDDPLAHLHILDPDAYLEHGSRHVHPRHIREARLVLIETLRLESVRVLHARIVREDQDMSLFANGLRYLVHRKHLAQRIGSRNGFAVGVETRVPVATNGFHLVSRGHHHSVARFTTSTYLEIARHVLQSMVTRRQLSQRAATLDLPRRRPTTEPTAIEAFMT